VEVGVLLAKSRGQLRVGRRRLVRVPFVEVIDGRLVVADAPEDPRRRDFGRGFGRELGAPFALFRVGHGVAAAEAAALDLHDGVARGRIRREPLAADAPEEIAAAARVHPQLGQVRAGRARLRRVLRRLRERRLQRLAGGKPDSRDNNPYSRAGVKCRDFR
jgi:hypothetical protein